MVWCVKLTFYILYKEKCDRMLFFACKREIRMVELTPCTEQGPACRKAPGNRVHNSSNKLTQYA